MMNRNFPALTQPTDSTASGSISFQKQIEAMIKNLLGSPIYRGRSGENLTTMTILKYNEYDGADSTMWSSDKIASFINRCAQAKILSSTDKDFINDILGIPEDNDKKDNTNIGLLNYELYLIDSPDESLPKATQAQPLIFTDRNTNISYLLYIRENDYRIVNINYKKDDNNCLNNIVVTWDGDEDSDIDPQITTFSVKGDKGDAAQGANYELGLGISFFNEIYNGTPNSLNIWKSIHLPIIYTYQLTEKNNITTATIVKADEPSNKVRYILDLKVLQFNEDDGPIDPTIKYAICQNQVFINDLIQSNIAVKDGGDNFKAEGNVIKWRTRDGGENSATFEGDIETVCSALNTLNLELWDVTSNAAQNVLTYPKCIAYCDVLLYEADESLKYTSFFSYNNGMYKTAWESYHRILMPQGLGDNSLKIYKGDDWSYAAYDVPLNACWEATSIENNASYNARLGEVVLTCYDVPGKQSIVFGGGYKELNSNGWVSSRLGFETGNRMNTALLLDYTKLKIQANQFHIQTASLNTNGEYATTPCLVGYGGTSHGDTLFGIDPAKLFAWMHSPGDIVLSEISNPKWYNEEDGLWELINDENNQKFLELYNTKTDEESQYYGVGIEVRKYIPKFALRQQRTAYGEDDRTNTKGRGNVEFIVPKKVLTSIPTASDWRDDKNKYCYKTKLFGNSDKVLSYPYGTDTGDYIDFEKFLYITPNNVKIDNKHLLYAFKRTDVEVSFPVNVGEPSIIPQPVPPTTGGGASGGNCSCDMSIIEELKNKILELEAKIDNVPSGGGTNDLASGFKIIHLDETLDDYTITSTVQSNTGGFEFTFTLNSFHYKNTTIELKEPIECTCNLAGYDVYKFTNVLPIYHVVGNGKTVDDKPVEIDTYVFDILIDTPKYNVYIAEKSVTENAPYQVPYNTSTNIIVPDGQSGGWIAILNLEKLYSFNYRGAELINTPDNAGILTQNKYLLIFDKDSYKQWEETEDNRFNK